MFRKTHHDHQLNHPTTQINICVENHNSIESYNHNNYPAIAEANVDGFLARQAWRERVSIV